MNKDILFGYLEAEVYYIPEELESESLFDESILEKTKIRRQKKPDEENQEGQVLKILTPD